jgi:glutamine cyclotransferase
MATPSPDLDVTNMTRRAGLAIACVACTTLAALFGAYSAGRVEQAAPAPSDPATVHGHEIVREYPHDADASTSLAGSIWQDSNPAWFLHPTRGMPS